MNILIFSASIGGGHNKAAEALQNHIINSFPNSSVKIIDTLSYINPLLDKTISNDYFFTIEKIPIIYKTLYEATDKKYGLIDFITTVNKLCSLKIHELLSKEPQDLVISTHPFAAEMISILKLRGKINIPHICIMTDYGPHETWIHEGVDSYIVASEEMKLDMIKRDVPEEKIYPYGIPINPKFYIKKDKAELYSRYNLSTTKPTVLMMAGSIGSSKIKDIFKSLMKIHLDIQVVAITGKNEKLYNKIKNISELYSIKSEVIYYSNEIDAWMHSVDLLITKPGGLTISEALAAKLPMILYDAIPGQEELNMDFIISKKMGVKLDNSENISSLVSDIFVDKNSDIYIDNLKANCNKYDKSDCINNITELLIKHLKQ